MLYAPAQAQLFRAYLSSTGNDANPCNLPQPCRLLPAALTAVASGGEIWMLDSANYNGAQVEVTKTVTILAIPGALGSVVATGGGNGLNINTPGVKVTLRNLVIVQLTAGYFGVNFAQGVQLNIENCEIANHPGMGGAVNATAPNGKLIIKDSVLRDSQFGLFVGGVVATLDHVRIENNGTGIYVNNLARLTMSNSVVSGNSTGITAYAGTGSNSQTVINHSEITGNNTGLYVQAVVSLDVAYVTLYQSVVTHNTYGIQLSQGASATAQLIVDQSAITNNVYGFNFVASGGVPTAYTRTNNTIKFNSIDFLGGAALTGLAAQ
jgi:hypothetical protein